MLENLLIISSVAIVSVTALFLFVHLGEHKDPAFMAYLYDHFSDFLDGDNEARDAIFRKAEEIDKVSQN